jgi:hypothetical protein
MESGRGKSLLLFIAASSEKSRDSSHSERLYSSDKLALVYCSEF